ncbi:hypothetical protein WA1_50620 [Scytonema hofmannii PCC 7110]|uniref:PD-(D/E)XK endonuclease-like domain-containing protein n=1 Tax=Scytonema hofmannii PCC 7110 TaxID=128403 RepID=A0A139WQH1_9CYAN|nr:hypothetical protein [Scytonema hofmannii]KYC34672.1 hypothetical protein WA1_50620 [Scytonema hofmannii PCC 7110]
MNRFNHKVLEIVEHNPECLLSQHSYLNLRSQSEVAGNQFHLIMQQIGLGLPVEPFLKEYPQIANWVDRVKPFLDTPGSKQWKAQLQYLYHQNLLYSEYDLVVYGEHQVIGFDWSIQKPILFDTLENTWQTQLRLFLLHQETEMPLEQISLIYLFVNTGNLYQFTYSKDKHMAFFKRLEETLAPFVSETENCPSKQANSTHMTPQEAHAKWMVREISTEEYLAAIPEVEI